MKPKSKRLIDKDLKLFLDIVKVLKQNIILERIRLIKNHYKLGYINRTLHFYTIKINSLIKRLQKRLKIQSIDKYLLNYNN